MFSIEKCPVPANTMLDRYSMNGGYTDCYLTRIPRQLPFPEFIFAFYTSSLFKLERAILKWSVSKPSTDSQARQLAYGEMETFATWRVEDRSENQLLMCDFSGRTRSWLMVIPVNEVNEGRTELYFGSAITPQRNAKTGERSLEFRFQVLLGFHKIYSVLLLSSAKSRINHRYSKTP